MLGDELKKSLEPIQTSDELLAKTRAAIEKARLEQAAASLNEGASATHRTSRLPFFLKAAVPVLCVALLVGGIFFLLPRMSESAKDVEKTKRGKGSRSQAANAESTSMADHNEEVDLIAEEAANAADGQDYEMAETTAPASEEEHNKNSDTSDHSISSEETASTETDNNHFFIPAHDVPFSDKQIVEVGEYLVCISEDGRSLLLRDKVTGDVIPESENHLIPAIDDLNENERITGLDYSEETESLYITVSDSTKGSAGRKVFICSFSAESTES